MQRINFTIDKTPPAVGITNPINGSFDGNIVNIAGIASDLHMEKISLEIDGINVADSAEYIWDSKKINN